MAPAKRNFLCRDMSRVSPYRLRPRSRWPRPRPEDPLSQALHHPEGVKLLPATPEVRFPIVS